MTMLKNVSNSTLTSYSLAHINYLIKNKSKEKLIFFDSRQLPRAVVNITKQRSVRVFAQLQAKGVTSYFYGNRKRKFSDIYRIMRLRNLHALVFSPKSL
ncbi:hypothetical protein PUN28_006193 [Cardiocondyla obscurior]|uniref:Uncharacterized protein n=1 Tax=Cardiocondyla obscurior TaxID=286306 RepID=A0AAW2G9H3_9HYME